jgi:hypothetical protein
MATCEESVEEIIQNLFDRKAMEARVREMMEIPWIG